MGELVFVILSWEGPDQYSHAGGLGSRVDGLSAALANLGYETHLFFIGDPDLPGHEVDVEGHLHLHRWCQWISRSYPAGVYDGEETKLADWNRSIPAWLETRLLPASMARGDFVVVLAEEWQTASSVIALQGLAKRWGWLDHIQFVWNANNTFSFHRIDWAALNQAATITTVSRFMKHAMWEVGVNPLVIPNGIPACWTEPVDREDMRALTQSWGERMTLAKVGRWDPNKRWDTAIDAVAELKRRQFGPLLLARGGREEHGAEVVARAKSRGLRVRSASWCGDNAGAVVQAIQPVLDADVVLLDSYLNEPQRRSLFKAVDAVLANSGIEPFGLVGLETMAVGGVAVVGATGEDYATPGHDAIAVQTDDPSELVRYLIRLRVDRVQSARIRAAARRSARLHTWQSVIERALLPALNFPECYTSKIARQPNSLFETPLEWAAPGRHDIENTKVDAGV